MIIQRCITTLFFVAISALTTWATAENVYKCGSTYSQSPCPGGKLLNVDDTRDEQQKTLKDEITQRDAALAKDMEKDRLANEQALRAAQTQRPPAHKAAAKAAAAHDTASLSKPKRLKHKSNQPKDFVAVVPDAKRKSVKKKSGKKTDPETPP